MTKERILIFCAVLLMVVSAPTLLPFLLGGIRLPVWAFFLYWTIVLINCGIYLANRLYLVDHFLVEGRGAAFLGWNCLLVVAGGLLQFLAVVFFEGFSDGSPAKVLDLTMRISQATLGFVLEILTILAALAISMADQWRYSSYRYKEAMRDNAGLQRSIDTLSGEVENLRKRQKSPEAPSFISVKVNLVMTQVPMDDILFVKADGDYIHIHKADGDTLMTLMTLKALERQLPFDHFCRTHRSYLVNVDKVEGLKDGKIRIGGERIPLSDSCKATFFEILSHKSVVLKAQS